MIGLDGGGGLAIFDNPAGCFFSVHLIQYDNCPTQDPRQTNVLVVSGVPAPTSNLHENTVKAAMHNESGEKHTSAGRPPLNRTFECCRTEREDSPLAT